MLFVDVEGEVSAASMVKDSKIYIEIAKFVQAYEAIVSDPNKFLTDINERPIDTEHEVLTWNQFVNIAMNCDLGFTPKPDEQTLAVYYSYAMQIGSISKESKRIATVEDIAEAQKKYYNFIDDTTTKVENQYKKQHEIASIRARDAAHVEKTISNKKLKMVSVFSAMTFGVFLCGIGLAGLFFDIAFVRFFGFGNRFIGGPILMVIGFLIFFFLDKYYVKFKKDYIGYKEDSKSIISRSDRTSLDEMVLKDKLDKYKEDLKIAQYEINDKNKTYDVSNAIQKLREKNKYFQDLLDKDGRHNRLGLFDEKVGLGIDDMPLKFKLGDKIDDFLKLGKKDPMFDMEHMTNLHGEGFIIGPDGMPLDPMGGNFPFDGKMGKGFKGRPRDFEDRFGRNENGDNRGDRDDRNSGDRKTQDEENRRIAEEQRRIKEEAAKKVAEQNEINGVKASKTNLSSSSNVEQSNSFEEDSSFYGDQTTVDDYGSSERVDSHTKTTQEDIYSRTDEVASSYNHHEPFEKTASTGDSKKGEDSQKNNKNNKGKDDNEEYLGIGMQ